MKYFCIYFFTIWICVFTGFSAYALDTTKFDDTALSQRYQTLTEELRCLVCQNETIAGSSAPLAQDLRFQVAEQIRAGQSDEQIRAYMTERYGEFIHYRPPVTGTTRLLWLAPLIFLIMAVFIFITVIRKRLVMSDDQETT